MKNEDGGILAIVITIVTILIILGVFILIADVIKNDINYGIKEGIVIDKRYYVAYTTTMTTGKVIIPQYHPANWKIKIQKEVNGETKEIWIDVDETTYHQLNINDYYPKNNNNT